MANEHIIGNDLQISGSLLVSQSITANKFYGDGSNLLYVTASTNWDGQYTGSAKITGSLEVKGGTADFRLASGVSGSFSGSFAGDGSRLTNLNLNGLQASGSILTGSFSGSFKGDGSQLTGVQTVWTGQYSGSAGITGSLNVSSAVTASIFTGAFKGDGSQLTGVTGEWDGSKSGNAEITGSLTVSGSNPIISLLGDTLIDENILISNKGDNTSISIGDSSIPESTQHRATIAIGNGVAELLVSGSENIFVGNTVASSVTNVQNTIAIGAHALASLEGQDVGGSYNLSDNIAIGVDALTNVTTGKYNVGVGTYAAGNVSTGDGNTALGYRAGAEASIISAKNVYIGHEAGPSASLDESNKLYIGNAAGTPLIYGDFATGEVVVSSKVTSPLFAGAFTGSFTGDGTGITGIVAQIQTGSLVQSASFNTYTSSIASELVALSDLIATSNTGSFTGSFRGDGSNLTGVVAEIQTGSLVANSTFNTYTSSANSQIVALGQSIAVANTGSFTGSFTGRFVGDGSQLTGLVSQIETGSLVTTASFNNLSSSVSSQIVTISQSIAVANTGSFTGSFRGDGSQLIGAGWSGTRNGDSNITGSLTVTNSVTAQLFTGSFVGASTGSFTGSFTGNGSNLTGILWSGTRNGDSNITGSLTVTNLVSASAFRGDGSQLTGVEYTGWDGVRSGSASITGSLTVTAAVTASAFVGSFIGDGTRITGIVSTNALSASFARTASLAVTASHAITASHAQSANISTFAAFAVESTTAATASLTLSAVSASFATTASYVAQADFATTTLNVLTASFATTASHALSTATAGVANTVLTVNNPNGNGVYYATFTDGTTGNTNYINGDGFTYAPTTNTLNVTSSYATLAEEVQGLVTVSNNTDIASPDNAGALRYRSTSNSSFVDMVMQTGATTYTWVNIVQNNW